MAEVVKRIVEGGGSGPLEATERVLPDDTGLTYVPIKVKERPEAPASGGDMAPKTAEWSPFNRKPGDRKGSIN